MKKGLKKLSLNRETVRNLESIEARQAAGGTDTCDTSCRCFFGTGCECASQGGTDCYSPSMCVGTCSC